MVKKLKIKGIDAKTKSRINNKFLILFSLKPKKLNLLDIILLFLLSYNYIVIVKNKLK